MPSYKTAGKSKQDLIVVAQLAGLLSAEEAAGKTRLQLVRLINAASKDAEVENDNSTADAKATATDHDGSKSDNTSANATEAQKKDTGRKSANTRKRAAAASTAGRTTTKANVRKSTAKKADTDEPEAMSQESAVDLADTDDKLTSARRTTARKSTRASNTSAAAAKAKSSAKSKISEKEADFSEQQAQVNSDTEEKTAEQNTGKNTTAARRRTAAKTTPKRSTAKSEAVDASAQSDTSGQIDVSDKKKTKTTRRATRKTASGSAENTDSEINPDKTSKAASEAKPKTAAKKQTTKTRTGRKKTDSKSGSKSADAAMAAEADKAATDKADIAKTDIAKAQDTAKTADAAVPVSETVKNEKSATDLNISQHENGKQASEADTSNQATNNESKNNPVQQVIAKKADEKQSVIKFMPKAPFDKKPNEAKAVKTADSEETSPEAAAAGLDQDASVSADKGRVKPERTQGAEPFAGREKAEQPRQQNRPNQRNGQTAAQDGNRAKRHQVEAGEVQSGVLEIMPDGYGFLRRDNYLQGAKDIYVPPQYIRRFSLRQGDYVTGPVKLQRESDRYQAILYIKEVNGLPPEKMQRRPNFDKLTPIYPDERFKLESVRNELSTRIIDLVAPIGKGQRGMIVSPPKAGKTILLQKIANAISQNNPDSKLIVLLIDERPEEVTDMQRSINGEVVYSTFDKTPENHTKVVELVLERAMRLVELEQDVVILLDSMTRLARAYNLTINPTGRTLSGGLDPGALYGPKRFFGAARNIEHGGSLTIIATSLIETGSRMDEVIFEEFKGTGNMEVYLDRKLSEKRIFPAIDINKSGTRREDLLLSEKELDAAWNIRKAFSQLDTAAVTEAIIGLLLKTQNNEHFIASVNVSFNDKNLYDAMRGKGGPGQQQGGSQAGGNGYKNGNGGSTGYRQ